MTKEEILKLTDAATLVDLSRNEIIFITPDEQVAFMNPIALRLRNLHRNTDYTKLTIEDLYDAETAPLLRKKLKELRDRKVSFLDLRAFNAATGAEIFLDSRISAVRTPPPDNELKGFGIMSFDITNEVGIQRELRKNQNYLHSIIETATDGIIVIDARGVIQSVNPAAADLFGYEPEEMTGQNISMMMPQPHRRQHDGYLENYHKSGVGKIIGVGREVEGKRKDGGTFPFRLSISKVKTDGKVFFTGIVHDLTDQKKAEAELLKLNKELEQRVAGRTELLNQTVSRLRSEVNERKAAQAALISAQKEIENALQKEKELSNLKSRFISTASHEFRTPLSAISSSASLIGRYNDTQDDKTDKRNKHVKKIQSHVKTMKDILSDFLSVSRLEEGKLKPSFVSLDLKSFADDIINALDTYKKPQQTIHYRHIGATEEIISDKHLLKNIIINLLSNAVKYSAPDGGIHLTTETDIDKNVTIRVKDHGIGIPEAEQKFLFDRFFRAKNAAHIQGTGLGLNILKQYTEILQGSISFESEEGKGTEFRIELPAINEKTKNEK